LEKDHNKVNTQRVLTASNAIAVDFGDGKQRGKMTQKGVLNAKRYQGQ